MARFRALALDLDGTLLTRDDRISPENLDAVRAAHEAGYAVIIATGRWAALAESVARELGVGELVVSCSGAQVRRLSDGQDLFDVRLPEAFAREVYAICDANRSITWAGDDAGNALLKMDGESAAPLPPGMVRIPSLVREGPPRPRAVLVQGSATCELVVGQLGDAWRDQVRFDWSLSGTAKRLLTVTGIGAHKGLALEAACRELGIERSEVLAFGDSDNDLELFRAAGGSVAMGQASDDVKAVATWTTVPGQENGVAVAIRELLRTGSPSREVPSGKA